jgi:tRNA A-37 threonylcarbamoyl transferase component Bud32
LRFAREAQILCRLDHPNLISIVDIDVTKDGVVFLVMELVRGSVLKQFRDRFGQLPFALTVLRQMTAGLATIHRSGIVHRDAYEKTMTCFRVSAKDAHRRRTSHGYSEAEDGSYLPLQLV